MLGLLIGGGSLWAEEETIALSNGSFDTDHITWNGTSCSITQSKISGSAVNSSYVSAPRMYKGHLLTFAAKPGYKISKITFTCATTYYGVLQSGSAIDGTTVTTTGVTPSYTSTSGGNHVLTCSNLSNVYVYNESNSSNLQFRFTALKVEYTQTRKDITALFKNNPTVLTPNTAGSISDYVSVPVDYDGTIYYTSDDEDVIVFDTDGSFLTGDHGTTTTIYATAAATSKYNAVNLSATVNIERAKAAAGIAYATPSYTFTCFDDKTTQALTNPNSLPVTYESSNTSVATVNEAGVVTVKDYAGTATITATFAGNENYYDATASFDITVNRAETGYAFSAASASVNIGEGLSLPTISATNANADLTLTFTSSNTSVATVASTGKQTYAVTINGVGTTTIKAAWNQTTRFAGGEASYTLTIADPNATPVETTYVKVTSTSELVAGAKYLIVNEDAEKTISNVSTGNNRPAVDVTFTDGVITAINANADVVTLGGSEGAWTFGVNGGYLYAANGSSSTAKNNYLKTQPNASDDAKATITFSDGNAVITFAGEHNGRNILQYNSNNSPIFSCYSTGSQSPVQLYKEVTSGSVVEYAQINITSAGYATYFNAFKYEMPTGLEGKIMKINAGGALEAVTVYDAGDVVPAETPLLIKGSEGTYVIASTDDDASSASISGNLLHGTLTQAETSGATGSEKYFMLGNGTKGLGWYIGANEGAAFTIGANKCYLVVDPALGGSSVKGFFSIEGSTETAIEAIEAENNSKAIYDLQGRRVNKATKGLYIVNGKKVLF